MRYFLGIVLVAALGAAGLSGCSDTENAAGSGGTAGTGGAAGSAGAGGTAGTGGTIEGFDPLEGVGTVELVQDGFFFTEGPHWRVVEQRLLFTDVPLGVIYELTPPDDVQTFREVSQMANGLASDADGLLLAAEHESRRVSRTLEDGTIVTVASEYLGDSLNSPNDIAVRIDGTIYFTDPPYGINQATQQELDFNGVFRVDAEGGLTAEWEGSLESRPNGLVLSPDERVLYVADTTQGVMAFDVAADGSLSNERPFVPEVAGADGMAMDTGGNLFVSTATGVQVFDPEGTLWGTIELPEGALAPANCAFGGADARTLYITARQSLFEVRLMRPGLY